MQLPSARAGRRREGRHSRRRRHADGVQHRLDLRRHHDGHRRACAPRWSAARSSPTRSSWSRAATCSTRWSCSSAATRPSPARRWRWRGSTSPASLLYGGSIAPGTVRRTRRHDSGRLRGRRRARGRPDVATRRSRDLESHACPGAGACGGQFTANTMATACEFLGIASMGSGDVPAVDADKTAVARHAGTLVMDVLKRGVRPSQLITREALENAIAAVAASGGSTNAVLHLLAIAREAGVDAAARRLRSHQRPRAAARRPEARRTLRRGRPAPRRRHAPARRAACSRRACCTTSAATVSGRTIGEEASGRRRNTRPGGDSAGQRAAEADRRTGRFCAATWRLTGAW